MESSQTDQQVEKVSKSKKNDWTPMYEKINKKPPTQVSSQEYYQWVQEQYSRFINPTKSNQLSREKKILLSFLPNWEKNMPDMHESWEQNRQKVIEFVNVRGRLPDNKIGEDDDEKFLASWCDRQRINFSKTQDNDKKQLVSLTKDFHWSSEKRTKLESMLPLWYWKKGDEYHWQYMANLVKQYQEKFQCLPDKTLTTKAFKHLFSWVQKQRRLFNSANKNGENSSTTSTKKVKKVKEHSDDEDEEVSVEVEQKFLSQEQIETLEAIKGWKWKEQKSDQWLEKFTNLTKFIDSKGRLPEVYSGDSNEQLLYKWITMQKKRYNTSGKDGNKALKPDKIEMLETLQLWTWNNESPEQQNKLITEVETMIQNGGFLKTNASKEQTNTAKKYTMWLKNTIKKHSQEQEFVDLVLKLKQLREQIELIKDQEKKDVKKNKEPKEEKKKEKKKKEKAEKAEKKEAKTKKASTAKGKKGKKAVEESKEEEKQQSPQKVQAYTDVDELD